LERRVVLSAQCISPAATQALEKICRNYWRPLYAFVRREGYAREEAQDLTQAFFARFLQRRDLDAVRREKGRCGFLKKETSLRACAELFVPDCPERDFQARVAAERSGEFWLLGGK
jgi:hypothetical protein